MCQALHIILGTIKNSCLAIIKFSLCNMLNISRFISHFTSHIPSFIFHFAIWTCKGSCSMPLPVFLCTFSNCTGGTFEYCPSGFVPLVVMKIFSEKLGENELFRTFRVITFRYCFHGKKLHAINFLFFIFTYDLPSIDRLLDHF